ncbi:Spore germination protein B3 precursor [Sporomusa ovata DSM 2662]|uniref:Spore germination protein GerKC n=1 Tax=Sporomusa ovata TaxID=2378 RepID=A0A0U1KTH0_9FIRM|nr:Ger(x)C family spore germination protein [Sporomusa ovata]EQB26598.1 spore germination protein KC [Sporomusa ovata DSM 2662]CQR70687.1 Spore germination protein GerKC [Sporomusa ovata]
MSLRKRMLASIVILVLALSLTGCWNRRELNTLGIVGLVGVDADNDGIKTTFEIINPKKTTQSGGEQAEPVKYVQATGRTVAETFRKAPLRFDRKLFVAHAKGFLFSEELARNGLAENLDMILRDHEARISMHLVIVKDVSAADGMTIASGINIIPSSYLEDILRQYKVHAKSVDSKVINFLKTYSGNGINPVVTVLQKVKKARIGTGKSEEYELSPEGAAVFKKDRLVGFLNGEETRGYNWVIGEVHSGIVVSPTPNSNGTSSVEIVKAVSKNEVEVSGNDIKIKVKISMTGMLDEETANVEITDQAVIAMLEQATSQSIKQEVEHTLLKVQTEYKSDIFGFGQLVHRKYPQEWKNMQDSWDDLFSQATIEVETQTKITKTGKSADPVQE